MVSGSTSDVMMARGSRTICVTLPRELIQVIDELSQRHSVTRSDIIRAALLAGLESLQSGALKDYVQITRRKVEEYENFCDALTAFLREGKAITLYYCPKCGKVRAVRATSKHLLYCPVCGILCYRHTVRPPVPRKIVELLDKIARQLDDIRTMLSHIYNKCLGYLSEEEQDKLRELLDMLSELYDEVKERIERIKGSRV